MQNLSAEIRRERWQLARVREAHFANAIRITKLVDLVSACGIPKDVREMAAKAFLEFQLLKRRRTCQPTPPIERALGCTLGCANSEDIGLTDAATRPKGYHTHVARCRASIASGGNALQPGRKEYEGTLKVDTFEDVKRIYSGKPDELYRRKTARKFATWRRKHREAEKERVYQELQAENVMKKRRGYDQILTSRTSGDASFAPFLFDLNNQTYAFSSKITEAPKLRKIMVDKYSAETSSSDGHVLNNWQKAHQAAENNPLFHTKVMNRFA